MGLEGGVRKRGEKRSAAALRGEALEARPRKDGSSADVLRVVHGRYDSADDRARVDADTSVITSNAGVLLEFPVHGARRTNRMTKPEVPETLEVVQLIHQVNVENAKLNAMKQVVIVCYVLNQLMKDIPTRGQLNLPGKIDYKGIADAAIKEVRRLFPRDAGRQMAEVGMMALNLRDQMYLLTIQDLVKQLKGDWRQRPTQAVVLRQSGIQAWIRERVKAVSMGRNFSSDIDILLAALKLDREVGPSVSRKDGRQEAAKLLKSIMAAHQVNMSFVGRELSEARNNACKAVAKEFNVTVHVKPGDPRSSICVPTMVLKKVKEPEPEHSKILQFYHSYHPVVEGMAEAVAGKDDLLYSADKLASSSLPIGRDIKRGSMLLANNPEPITIGGGSTE